VSVSCQQVRASASATAVSGSVTATEIIRTIRGDIDPADLGPCDAHEHLFLVTPALPGDEYSDVPTAIEEAKTLRAAGARALVDWTPIGLGRDLDGLRTVSEATGLHVVAATGLHRAVHYAADDPVREESEDALADRFAKELERCGIIKVGASYHALAPFEAKAFAAAWAPRSASTPSTGRWAARSSSGSAVSASGPSA
jgi:predicted metal-dependent phosphotriesterase family hydrolase